MNFNFYEKWVVKHFTKQISKKNRFAQSKFKKNDGNIFTINLQNKD